jgi:hypothetical protein
MVNRILEWLFLVLVLAVLVAGLVFAIWHLSRPGAENFLK